MLAVSTFADSQQGCPTELAEALWCEQYHFSPSPGSLDDQDVVRLSRYDQLMAILRACNKRNQGDLKSLSKAETRIVMEIARLQKNGQ